MNRLERIVQIETPKSAPRYELRVRHHGATDTEYQICQVPAEATPQVKNAVRVAGLRGRNLELVEHRVLRRLARAGIRLSRAADDRRRGYNRHRGPRPDAGPHLPHARTDAKPREHAGRRRRNRGDGARGDRLLARDGDAPAQREARPERPSHAPHRTRARRKHA